jgi:predicted DNA-binding transcriptional regulator YafY
MKITFGESLDFNYTNWRGVTSLRTVIPHHLWYGVTQYHPHPQWFLHGLDVPKQELRDFALADILIPYVTAPAPQLPEPFGHGKGEV